MSMILQRIKLFWNGVEGKNAERRRKNEIKNGLSERKNSLLSCFRLFKYVIDYTDLFCIDS